MQAPVSSSAPPQIVFLGIKHCGKTTLGRHLACHLGVPFFDTDEVILEQQGKTARDVMVTGSKAALLTAEVVACTAVAAQGPAVIATGGGICDNSAALDALRGGLFVFVDVPEKTLCDRILQDPLLPAYIAKERPVTDDDVRRIFHPIYDARRRLYLPIADLVFIPKDLAPAENARALLEVLNPGNPLPGGWA